MIDWLETLAGGVVGLALVYLVDWVWRPCVKEVNFLKESVNFGTLYKFCFQLKGKSQPGLCALAIEWGAPNGRKTVFAKWDETPNPLEGDCLDKFRPELVPSTFYQPLFFEKPYTVPVIILPQKGKGPEDKEDKGSYEVFSAWWFGKEKGYGPDPRISEGDELQLTLTGGNFRWSKRFSVSEILKSANDGNTKC